MAIVHHTTSRRAAVCSPESAPRHGMALPSSDSPTKAAGGRSRPISGPAPARGGVTRMGRDFRLGGAAIAPGWNSAPSCHLRNPFKINQQTPKNDTHPTISTTRQSNHEFIKSSRSSICLRACKAVLTDSRCTMICDACRLSMNCFHRAQTT